MDKIYKYPLQLTGGAQSRTLPHGAEIVHFSMQGDTPCIWARIPDKSFGTAHHVRQFWIVGTGHDIKDGLKHIGTVLHGDFVWHLFEQES